MATTDMANDLPADTSETTPLASPHDVSRTETSTTTTAGQESILNHRAPLAPNQPQEGVGSAVMTGAAAINVQAREYANGYHFPPKYPVKEQITMGIVALWEFYNTGFGFFLVVYALLVVGWGGMIFLLLCNAAPVMCYDGDCNHIDSPRRIWIEIDSQVLNALFCVTGFGLAPWRIRDFYYLMKYRLQHDHKALRTLAGIHRGWFRLQGSETLPAHLGPKNAEEAFGTYDANKVPYPVETTPDAPLTGMRAPPSKLWKLDLVVWLQIWNTLFQICLSAFMWAMDRYARPSWSTGLFVCLACIVACWAGILMGIEGKQVKIVEGVPLTKGDIERLARDRELGITHHNNYHDKDPAEEKAKKSKGRGWLGRSEKTKEDAKV
jgi:hypothetical protein